MSYVITTDTTSDLPESFYQEHEMTVLSMSYFLEDETYCRGKKELDWHEFYEKMRGGSMPTTAQVNPETAREGFEPLLKAGKDILHIAFSSGLSGSYNSICMAAQDLMEEYPERKIIVVDSLCASMGEGFLVYKAMQQQAKGMTLEQTAAWCETHKLNVVHSFTVDNLFHLFRGGRVSRASAIVGTMLSIKPILHVDAEGHLKPLSNVRGRKKALQALVKSMEEKQGSYLGKNDIVFISHGDCRDDAEYVKKLIQEKYGIQSYMIDMIGPTVGAHSGPGTVALFFMGDQR